MIMEQLEDRIVLDAAVGSIHYAHPFHPADRFVLLDPRDLIARTSHVSGPVEPVAGLQGHPVPTASAAEGISQVFDGNLDMLLVSDALTGSKEIANAASPHTKVVFYSAAHDDLDAINEKLGDLTDHSGKKIAHLAVASQVEDSILGLGSEPMDLDVAIVHRTSFSNLGSNLEPHAQIQLYSCTLAGSEDGQLPVHAIATMTGDGVFASADVTGVKPHNWVLEYSTYPKAEMVPVLDMNELEQVPGQLEQLPATHPATSDPAAQSSSQLIASYHGDRNAVSPAMFDLGTELNVPEFRISQHTAETMR